MYPSSILAVFGLATFASAHMIMNTPVPFGKSTLNSSPLDTSTGVDFPCKQRTGVYDAEGASNTMAIGSVQPLKFTGSAVHGGGSCQISVTYDQKPTKSSVFKVIHSIEGGCPMQNITGNNGDDASAVDPDTYSFTIPASLPTGTATLAWTWFNKVGNREMYMNCAPITITSGSSKREELEARNTTQLVERDMSAFNALPDMFTANLAGPSGCGTVSDTDLIFPNPGDSLERLGLATSSALAAPTGPCSAAAASGSGSAPSSAPTSIQTSPSVVPIPASSSTPSLSGGVFATSAPSVSASAPAASQTSSIAPAAPAATTSAASSPAATGTSSAGGLTGPCTTEGMWNCVGGTSFQQCASGSWSIVQPLAAGTKCTAGQSSAIQIDAIARPKEKRAIRFPREHIRRHASNAK